MYLEDENIDDIFFNIINYITKLEIITEDDKNKYLSIEYEDRYEIIKNIFEEHIECVDFDTKIEIIKYLQEYVKDFYNEESKRQIFVEKVLDEFLLYVSFYDPKFVKKVRHKTVEFVGNMEDSLIKDELMIKTLFSFPVRISNYLNLFKHGWSNMFPNRNMYLLDETIEKNFINDKLSLADELMELLYNSNQEFFNKIFISLLTSIEIKNVKCSDNQICLLKKWADKSNEKEYNNCCIVNNLEMKKNLTCKKEYNVNLLNLYKNDIVKYEKIIKYLLYELKEDEELVYNFIKSIVLDKLEIRSKDGRYEWSMFQITLTVVSVNYKIICDDFIIDCLIDIIEDEEYKDDVIQKFLSIFDTYVKNKDNVKAVNFAKKLIDRKPKFAVQLVSIIIYNLKGSTNWAYLNNVTEIVNHARFKGLTEFNSLYEEQITSFQLRTNKELDITDYILSVKSNMTNEDIKIINKKIKKLMHENVKIEDYVDFEKVIEYIIKNKKFFIHKENYCYYSFNYIEWYFKAIEKITSNNILNSLMKNLTIQEDILNLMKTYVNGKPLVLYKDYNYGPEISLKSFIVNSLAKKKNNQEVISIIQSYVKVIQDPFSRNDLQEVIDIIKNLNNNECYNSSENIEILSSRLENINVPDELYAQFILKLFEYNYEYVDKIFMKFLKKVMSVDCYIYELYKNQGIEILNKLFSFDADLKEEFLKNASIELIISIQENIAKEGAIEVLKFLIDNMEKDNNKYKLIKSLLYSQKYREIVTLQELDYINSAILTIENSKYKRELLRKWELLYKKRK